MRMLGSKMWLAVISLSEILHNGVAFVHSNGLKVDSRVSLLPIRRIRNQHTSVCKVRTRLMSKPFFVEQESQERLEPADSNLREEDGDNDTIIENVPLTTSMKQVNGVINEETSKDAFDIDMLLSRWNDDPWVEIVSGALVLLSSLLVAIGTLPFLSLDKLQFINGAQDAITVIFTLEFFTRWAAFSSTKKKKLLDPSYLWQPLTLVDLVSVWAPLLIMTSNRNLSALVNLRLLRILKLQRVLEDTTTFNKFVKTLGFKAESVRPYQLQLARVLLSVFTLLSISTGFIYSAEHGANPQFSDYFTALYFGLTTLTTVGFGDIAPVTFEGRLVVMGSILAGVAIIPAQAASLVEALLNFQTEQRIKREKQAAAAEKAAVALLEQPSPGKKSKSCFANFEVSPPIESCPTCNAREHRYNAKFCWNCGSKFV